MSNARKTNYTTSLTSELFLFDETRILAKLLLDGADIQTISQRNLAENLISCKRPGSLKRINSTLVARLAEMNDGISDALISNNIDNSRIVLLYIICKTDKLVRDFVLNIYSDKLITRSDRLTRGDIEKYFDKISEVEPKFLKISPATKTKMQSALARLLVLAGIVSKGDDDFRIIRPVISGSVKRTIQRDGGEEFLQAMGVNL